jgi:hypothetical protein
VPARAHGADGGAVVLVGPAVLGEPPEVQDSGHEQQEEQLGPRAAERAPRSHAPRSGRRAGGSGAFEKSGGGGHRPQLRRRRCEAVEAKLGEG